MMSATRRWADVLQRRKDTKLPRRYGRFVETVAAGGEHRPRIVCSRVIAAAV